MKTEWHRYNLKRRVAQLAPVSNEIFQHKVANTKNSVQYDDFGFIIESDKQDSKVNKKKVKARYDLLNRGRQSNIDQKINKKGTEPLLSSRDTSPALSEHSTFSLGTLKSQSDYGYDTDNIKIRSDVSRTRGFDSDYNTEEYLTEEFESDDNEYSLYDEVNEALPLNECFYCGMKSTDIEGNINHLLKNHNLYIPDLKYLSDKEGLIRYLSDNVVLDKVCIKCGYESNKLMGIRQHIIAKGHACIPYESKEERQLFKQFYNFDNYENGNEESEESEDELFEDLTTEDDNEITVATIDSTGVELALPNGYKLGHRSMNRYYKQNIITKTDRRLSEGEKTIMVLNKENEKLLKIQETAKHNEEVKRVELINRKQANRELSDNGLKYRNNLENYRNQRFG